MNNREDIDNFLDSFMEDLDSGEDEKVDKEPVKDVYKPKKTRMPLPSFMSEVNKKESKPVDEGGFASTYDDDEYEDLEESEIEDMNQSLTEMDGVEGYMPALLETYDAELEDGQTQSVTVTVPLGDLESFSDYVTLRERGQEPIPNAIVDKGPFITERMGELLNLSENDSFTLENEDFEEFTVEDFTVVENYASHYLYVNPEQYESIFGEEPSQNAYLVHYTEGVSQKETEEAIMDNDNVLTTVDLNTLAESIADQMGSLD